MLVEIPEGSIPVKGSNYTKSTPVILPSYTTKTVENFFYFPQEGNFSVYPANVSKNGVIIAIASRRSFHVINERTLVRDDTIEEVLATGKKSDILKFAATKNILNRNIFDFDKILQFLYDKHFYLDFIEILRKRCIYNNNTWAFSMFHADEASLREFFEARETKLLLSNYVKNLTTSVVSIKAFTFLEYFPLINSRVHSQAGFKYKPNVQDVLDRYKQLVNYLVEAESFSLEDKLSFIYYLLLQDRIDQGLRVYKTIQRESVEKEGKVLLQYDYIAAYLDFFTG